MRSRKRSRDSEVIITDWKSQLYLLLAVWPWASHLIPLSPDLFLWKWGNIVYLPHALVLRIKWDSTCDTLEDWSINAYLGHINNFCYSSLVLLPVSLHRYHLISLRAPAPESSCFLLKLPTKKHNRVLSYERSLDYVHTSFQVASGRTATLPENLSWELLLVEAIRSLAKTTI